MPTELIIVRVFQKRLLTKKLFYSSDFNMTDKVIRQLETFSKVVEDDTCSIYIDNGELIII